MGVGEGTYISQAITEQEEKRSLSAEAKSGMEIKNGNLNLFIIIF